MMKVRQNGTLMGKITTWRSGGRVYICNENPTPDWIAQVFRGLSRLKRSGKEIGWKLYMDEKWFCIYPWTAADQAREVADLRMYMDLKKRFG